MFDAENELPAEVFVSDMSSPQRKRRGTGSAPVPRLRTKTARRANARIASNTNSVANREASREASIAAEVSRSDGEATPTTETIDVMEDGVEEVVDLTCEGGEAVVDLTNNDSVLLVDEGPQNGRDPSGESYVVSSDEEAAPPNAAVMPLGNTSSSRSAPGMISCPICLDMYSEIVDSGRLVVSTKCGHVFCSQCLRDALKSSHTCPTCRKKLTPRQYHPLYV